MEAFFMTGTVDGFLAVESDAAQLVDALTRLRSEMESYRSSRTSLDAAGAGVTRLADELAEIGQRVGGVVETLRAIGTPELLRAQDDARTELAGLRAELAEAQRATDSNLEAQRRSLETAMSEVRGEANRTASIVSGLRGLVLIVGGTLLIGIVAVAALVLTRGPAA
jgi:hypothetical protein